MRILYNRNFFWGGWLVVLLAACLSSPTETAVLSTSVATRPTPSPTQHSPQTPSPTHTPAQVTITRTPTPSPPSPSPTPSVWQKLATMPTNRSEMPAVLVNGRIYVPGGFGNSSSRAEQTSFEAYDIATDTWHTLAELPNPMNHHMLALFDDQIYLFPPERAPVLRYDMAADGWTELGVMPAARWAGTAVTLKEHIYIIGGASSDQTLLRYDPDADTWDSLTPPQQPREHVQAVALNNEIFLLGGRWERGLNSVEIYNPETDTWRRGPSMNQPRSGFGATLFNGQIVVAGGELLSPLNIIDTVEFYDPQTQQWTLVEQTLPVPLHGMPLVADDTAIYVIGGSGVAGSISNRGQVYRWQPGAAAQK